MCPSGKGNPCVFPGEGFQTSHDYFMRVEVNNALGFVESNESRYEPKDIGRTAFIISLYRTSLVAVTRTI